MSNYLCIATVTATLARVLYKAAQDAIEGATVSMQRPESVKDGSPEPKINIYLYHVTPNAALRNDDLPTRSSDGSLVRRPPAAYDLHYIITFFGDETQLQPQRLLGSTISMLHAQPLLTRELIQETIDTDSNHYLAGSDLAEQIEKVRFIPQSISKEELFKLWSFFFQSPYALSILYKASVVLIEAEGALEEAPVVQTPIIHSVPKVELT